MKFEVKHLCFSYQSKPLLQDISFQLNKGEILTILGPNGVGKSTLFKCILGFLKIKSGEIFVDDQQVTSFDRHFYQKIAYVPQAKTTTYAYSVLETILMGRTSYHGIFHQPSKEDIQIALEALSTVGISHLQDHNTNALSGGERQLVYIARALCTKPEMLVMDEPETGLDFQNQLKIMHIIKQLSKQGISIILNTHDPSHALALGDCSMILCKDSTYQYGQTKQIITKENLEKAYEVPIHISDLQINDETYYAIFPHA